ncbi:unnamed protein product, partial [Oikopleura dioica]
IPPRFLFSSDARHLAIQAVYPVFGSSSSTVCPASFQNPR